MLGFNIFTIVNYVIKGFIIIIWAYFIYNELLTLNRILIFIVVFFIIYGYSRFAVVINYIFLNKNIIKYIKDHNAFFIRMLYVLLDVHRWINPFIVFLVYTDKCLYKINRYITGTRFIHYNFVIYVLAKYLIMFGLIKLIIYKYYNFWYKLYKLTIVDILFKRMYGLILSILIFTDLFNNIIGFLSQYSVWIYILIYYVLSTLCVMWELLYFYYDYKIVYKKIEYIMFLFNNNFQEYTKMDITIFLRSQFTWLGRIINDILEILIPKENNFKEKLLSITKVSDTGFVMSGCINYYIPVENRISLKYFDNVGGFIDFDIFEPTFELYWKSFKYNLCYYSFFKLINESKYKPSIFLYKNIQELLKLYDVQNQPINRLMNWLYFECKYKENQDVFMSEEKEIISRNLSYFKKVDDLRAKLMLFIIWDIEYFYNKNNKDYSWNYWIFQYHSILEELICKINDNLLLNLLSKNIKIVNQCIIKNKKILKFYDPEENMEFLNRLFDVLGIVNIDVGKYYVSKKFINYNNKYVELLIIMYTYDYKRWEEPMCECKYLSNYEVEVGYKMEDYFQNLRKEWEMSIKTEKLEERNWKLLKSLEDLMYKR